MSGDSSKQAEKPDKKLKRGEKLHVQTMSTPDNTPKEPLSMEKQKEHNEMTDDFQTRWEQHGNTSKNNLEKTVAEAADGSKPVAEKTYTDAELINYFSELKTKYNRFAALISSSEALGEEDKNILREYKQIVDILAEHCPKSLSKYAEEIMTLNEKFEKISKEYEAKLQVTENRYKTDTGELESKIKNLQSSLQLQYARTIDKAKAEIKTLEQPTQELRPSAVIGYEKPFLRKGRVYVDVAGSISGHFIPERTRNPLIVVGNVTGESYALFNVKKKEYYSGKIDEGVLKKIVRIYAQGQYSTK
jgi:hypothetical protein